MSVCLAIRQARLESSENGHLSTNDQDRSPLLQPPEEASYKESEMSHSTTERPSLNIPALSAGLHNLAKRKCVSGAPTHRPNACVFSLTSGPPKHKPPPPVKAGSSTEMVSGPACPATQSSSSPGLYSAHSFECRDTCPFCQFKSGANGC